MFSSYEWMPMAQESRSYEGFMVGKALSTLLHGHPILSSLPLLNTKGKKNKSSNLVRTICVSHYTGRNQTRTFHEKNFPTHSPKNQIPPHD